MHTRSCERENRRESRRSM